MRLNCPSCGTGYDVPDGMIPPGGRHVQCTDCHTRWFVRGVARPMLSEDQIISRLESRSRPRAVPFPDPPPEPEAAPAAEAAPKSEPAAGPGDGFVWEGAADPPAEPAVAKLTDEPAKPAPVVEPARSAPAAAFVAPPPPQPRAFAPDAAPPSRPTFRPAPSPAPSPASSPASGPAPRIDLTSGRADGPAAAQPRNRFALGLTLALGAFAVLLFTYGAHEAIASRLPAVAPALDAYVGAIDALRQDVAATFGGGSDDG